MNKRYAGDFDPATLVIELCKYSTLNEENIALRAALKEIQLLPSSRMDEGSTIAYMARNTTK